jgi:hypothetical protein
MILPEPDGLLDGERAEEEDSSCFFQFGIFRHCFHSEIRDRSALILPQEAEVAELLPPSPSKSEASSTYFETFPMRRTSSKLELRVFPLDREQAWEELEDDLFLILNGRSDHLEEFQKLHTSGLTRSNILRSLAYLASRPNKRDESLYFEHISSVAVFLAIGRSPRELKLAALKILMTSLSPVEASWQIQESVIDDTLVFLTRRSVEWEYMEHTETIILWELRAMCLRQIEQEQKRVDRVASTGDTAAVYIATGATLMQAGMARSVPAISQKIDTAGKHIKGMIKSDEYPLMMSRNAVVAMVYSDAAKRASEGARETTFQTVVGIRDASARGLNAVARKFDNSKLAESLPPEGREVMKAVGKVGMATIGAAAVVAEAMVDTSREVIEKTASVTADVVKHKYGTSAGQVVKDAGDTATNVFRALTHVAMLEGSVAAKALVTDSGKNHVKGEISNAKESLRFLEQQASSLIQKTIKEQEISAQLKAQNLPPDKAQHTPSPRKLMGNSSGEETKIEVVKDAFSGNDKVLLAKDCAKEQSKTTDRTNNAISLSVKPTRRSSESSQHNASGRKSGKQALMDSSSRQVIGESQRRATIVSVESCSFDHSESSSTLSDTSIESSSLSSSVQSTNTNGNSQRNRVPLTPESRRRGSVSDRPKRAPLTPDSGPFIASRRRSSETSRSSAHRKRTPLTPDKGSICGSQRSVQSKENKVRQASRSSQSSGSSRTRTPMKEAPCVSPWPQDSPAVLIQSLKLPLV